MHELQKKLLDLLSTDSIDNLTLREIGELVGVEHPQLIQHHLKQLEKKGYIRREPNTNSYITFKNPIKDTVTLPIYGIAQCGHKNRINDPYNVDKVELPTMILNIRGTEDLILVRAEGLSMAPEIKENDLVLIKKQNCQDNENQTCLVIDDGTAKIKKVIRAGKDHILISTNPNFAPQKASKNFEIIGVVKNVIAKID